MSAQTTLTEDAPWVLDSTCSDKKIWPKFASLRMDTRVEVKPDIVASATHLPFRDGIFERIYCDPPHYIHKEGMGFTLRHFKGMEKIGDNYERFGHWDTLEQFLSFLKAVDAEFDRCLTNSGTLYFKIACSNEKQHRMLRRSEFNLSNFEVTHEKITESIAFFSNALTYWLTMKPKHTVTQTVTHRTSSLDMEGF